MIVATLLAVVWMGASILAQQAGTGRGTGPVYDAATEATFQGTVQSVEQIADQGREGRGRGRRALGGTHIILSTATGPVEVHVGPAAFLTENKVVIVDGDAVEIIGSRVSLDDEPFVVAREIRKGDQTWTLRDATGRPLWSGGRRGDQRR